MVLGIEYIQQLDCCHCICMDLGECRTDPTRLIILLLWHPHGLEGGERGENWPTSPGGVLPRGRSNDLDLHGVGGKGGDLPLHAVSDSGEHGGSTRQDNIGVQVPPGVNVGKGTIYSLRLRDSRDSQDSGTPGRLMEKVKATSRKFHSSPNHFQVQIQA